MKILYIQAVAISSKCIDFTNFLRKSFESKLPQFLHDADNITHTILGQTLVKAIILRNFYASENI